jgi:hypothetical protein
LSEQLKRKKAGSNQTWSLIDSDCRLEAVDLAKDGAMAVRPESDCSVRKYTKVSRSNLHCPTTDVDASRRYAKRVKPPGPGIACSQSTAVCFVFDLPVGDVFPAAIPDIPMQTIRTDTKCFRAMRALTYWNRLGNSRLSPSSRLCPKFAANAESKSRSAMSSDRIDDQQRFMTQGLEENQKS